MKSGAKKFYLVSALVVVLLFLGSAYVVFRLTRPFDPQWMQDPNPVEAYHANLKVTLVSGGSSAKGYVRLSEVEINSYIQEKLTAQTNAVPTSLALEQAGVTLTSSNLTFICWTRQKVLGLGIPLVYQRSYRVGGTNVIQNLHLETIKVGDLEIPGFLRGTAESFFAGMDSRFEERRNWVAQLPLVRFALNELSRHPEVVLYNYVPRDL